MSEDRPPRQPDAVPETVGRRSTAARRVSLGLLALAAAGGLAASIGLGPPRLARPSLPAAAGPLADSAALVGREVARQASDALAKHRVPAAEEEAPATGPAPKLSRPVEPGRKAARRRKPVDIRPELPVQHPDAPVLVPAPEPAAPFPVEGWAMVAVGLFLSLFFAAWAWYRSDRAKSMT